MKNYLRVFLKIWLFVYYLHLHYSSKFLNFIIIWQNIDVQWKLWNAELLNFIFYTCNLYFILLVLSIKICFRWTTCIYYWNTFCLYLEQLYYKGSDIITTYLLTRTRIRNLKYTSKIATYYDLYLTSFNFHIPLFLTKEIMCCNKF